jgi:hypothetical protein
MDTRPVTVTLTLAIPTDCTNEQIDAALRETIGEQLDSWVVTDVEVVSA